MTAPVLTTQKFYVIKPWSGENQIKNPRFDMPDGKEDWGTSSTDMSLENSSTYQRFGAYSMKVNPITATNSAAYYTGLSVVSGTVYTFSCYVKGTAGQAMRVFLSNVSNTVKGTTQFTATGYWQRAQVTVTADATASDWYAAVQRDAVAGTTAFYVDGAQFEVAGSATTLMTGYTKGCRWTGNPRNSTSTRDANSTEGGWIVDLETYCHVVQSIGLGHGDWNQIMTKMTSGGDMYQTHIRKSRNFSLIVDFLGTSLSEIETNRKAVIDLIRPDAFEGQERIIRYTGVDVNGYEATNPVDIRCVPLSATMTETPDLPTYQRAILNFAIPSGLLDGAYNEGAVLDFDAEFAAEFIVKRDANGNWCEASTDVSGYGSLITGLNGIVYCMAEGQDGKIYAGGDFTDAGGTTDADYLARWNTTTEKWEKVVAGVSNIVQSVVFDANGDLYIGGLFLGLGTTDGNFISKITDVYGTPTANVLGTGLNNTCYAITIDSNGDVYAGGAFTSAGGVANTARIAKWNGSAWSALATGLNNNVNTFAFAPNGNLYVGGDFTNATTDSYGDYLCYWDGSKFNRVGTVELGSGGYVKALEFDAWGNLYVGGTFTNAGGLADADYIAAWNGSSWIALGTGTNAYVTHIGYVYPSGLIVSGAFSTAGGLSVTDKVAVWANGAWQPLSIDLPGTAGFVQSTLHVPDGSIYIGGNFSSAGSSDNAHCAIVSDTLSGTGVTSASANTYPYMQITGPGTLASITNWTTGKSVMFDGLALQAGETITLSFDPLNLQFKSAWAGRGNLMRYVVAGSDYGDFYLKPGTNYFSFYMPSSTTDTYASVTWVPKFWGLDGAVL